MSKVIIYCDEAGNTGPNYVDPEQPIYALGAWSVPFSSLADVAATVEKHRQKYAPQEKDFSARKLVKKNKGQTGILSLLTALGELGCIPLFGVMEKRFCVAAKIVEVFMDPMFNPKLTTAIIGDTTTKIEIANSIYEHVADNVLADFSEAYEAPTADNLEACLDDIAKEARRYLSPELANVLEGSRPNLKELAEFEGDAQFFGKARATPNVPAFVAMLMMVEKLARTGAIDPIKLVHDESSDYEVTYAKLHTSHKHAKESIVKYPNGAEVLLPLKYIPEFEVDDSKTSPFLQAADILAGTVVHITKAALKKRALTPTEVDLANRIFPALLSDEPRLAWTVGSDRWNAEIAKCFLEVGVPNVEVQPDTAIPRVRDVPMLPAAAKPTAPNVKSVAFPSQPVGIVSKRLKRLLVVNESHHLMPHEGESAVLLFASEATANRVLTSLEQAALLDDAFEIAKYNDLKQFQELISQLEEAAQVTDTLLIDWLTEVETKPMHLPTTVAHLQRLMERNLRAKANGIINELFQKQFHKGVEIHSLLLSEGGYMALIPSTSVTFKFETREEAIAAAISHIDANP
jgi:hypothetical protein